MEASYQAWYRAYRPQAFRDVVGQEHAVRVLRNAVRLGRLAHAYLLSGPRGTGKTTLAKILARAANCENPSEGDPCGICSVCVGQGLHTLEIDAASNRGIDEIRDLRERARYLPPEGRWKVYIIDEAHMLTAEAFNALLKTLEEPPAHLIFVLATTEPERMPATVLSRCQRLRLRRLDIAEIREHLLAVAGSEGIALDADAAMVLARQAEGSMRDGLAWLELSAAFSPEGISFAAALDVTGGVPDEILAALTGCLQRTDAEQLVLDLDRLLQDGREAQQVLREWQAFLRDALFSASGARPWDRQGANPCTLQEAADMLRRLGEAEGRMRLSGDPRTTMLAHLLSEGAPATQRESSRRQRGSATAEVAVPTAGMQATAVAAVEVPPVSDGEGFQPQRLLAEADRRDKRVGALLKSATVSVQNGALVVRVRFEKHLQMLQQEELARALREAAGTVLPGVPLRVEN